MLFVKFGRKMDGNLINFNAFRYLGFGATIAETQADENLLKRMYLGVCKSMKNIGFTIEVTP